MFNAFLIQELELKVSIVFNRLLSYFCLFGKVKYFSLLYIHDTFLFLPAFYSLFNEFLNYPLSN